MRCAKHADSNLRYLLGFLLPIPTSVLEAWFSLVREENVDGAVNYPAMVTIRKMAKATKALSNNKCYTSDEV